MRVLIADDNQDSAQSLALLLQTWGFEPVVFYDGRAALAALREQHDITVALVDWVMPGATGIELCRAMRQDTRHPYTYIILVTGQNTREQMLDGLAAGADDYLIKPVDPSELRARLRTATRIVELQEQLLSTQRLLLERATHDSLTGLWNRAMILETLDREVQRSQREHHPLAVIMADIDHFKAINDTYGHLTGDAVLRAVTERLLGALRPYDAVGRYGGEEFLVVLPGCGLNHAATLADRLRECVESARMTDDGRQIAVTVSLGVSALTGGAVSRNLLHDADAALYRSKQGGRNRVSTAETAHHESDADPKGAIS